jgi:pyruvate,orthophosphate dikinase
MKVRTNAETPPRVRARPRASSAPRASACAAPSTCSSSGRIIAVREMILAETRPGRREALAKLLPMQRSDFTELFEVMAGLPVTIRLLDPPLHEFLPQTRGGDRGVAKADRHGVGKLKQRATELHEFNPMLGHRGCRLGVTFPRSTRCRRAPSSRRRWMSRKERRGAGPRDHDPARRHRKRARAILRAWSTAPAKAVFAESVARPSTISSAR